MKDQRKTEIKVGFTVILGLFLILWVLGWAKNWTVNSQRKELSVEFSAVAGLEVGDPVTINGVRKGYVNNIRLNADKVLTQLNLDPDVLLKEDSKFSIMMLDLMGGKKVEVHPGVSVNEINYKALQHGEFVGDVASSMALLGSVQNDLVDVIKDVKKSLSALNKTITDEQFSSDLKSSLANLTKITENLSVILKNNSAEINKILKSGAEFTNDASNFIKTNKDSIAQTISNVNSTLRTSKDLLVKINDFMDKTNKNQNNLGKLLNDTDLMNDLKTTVQQAKDLTKIIIEQLKSKGFKVDADVSLF
jgi:phospholipid/cholesterol/gamma-HCH transport system substrate-binding protein